MISQIVDHSDRAVALMLSRYQKSATVAGLLRILVDEVQRFENLAHAVYIETLATAIGDGLDVYGELVGAKRLGMSDDDYRRVVRSRIAAFRAEGIGARIQAVVAFFVESPIGVAFIPLRPRPGYAVAYTLPEHCEPLSDAAVEQLVQLWEIMQPAAGVGQLLETYQNPLALGFDHDAEAVGFNDPLGDGHLVARVRYDNARAPALTSWAQVGLETVLTSLDSACPLAPETFVLELDGGDVLELDGGDVLEGAVEADILPREGDRLFDAIDTVPIFRVRDGVARRGALRFDGAHNLAVSGGPLAEGAAPFSLYLRLRMRDLSAAQAVFGQAEEAADQSFSVVFLPAIGIRITIETDGISAASSIDVALDDYEWHDLVVVRGGGTLDAYLDGALAATTADAGSLISDAFGAVVGSTAQAGEAWNGAQEFYWQGELAALGFWRAAHDAAERADVLGDIEAVEGALRVRETVVQVLEDAPSVRHIWPMDDAAGTLRDIAGAAPLSLGAGASAADPQAFRGVVQSTAFDGAANATATASNAALVADLGQAEDWTVLLAARFDFTPGVQQGAVEKLGGGVGWQMLVNAGDVEARLETTAGSFAIDLTPVDDVTTGWQLFALAWRADIGELRLHAGAFGGDASSAAAASVSGDFANAADLVFGQSTGAAQNWEGQQAAAAVLQVALDADEVQDLLDRLSW